MLSPYLLFILLDSDKSKSRPIAKNIEDFVVIANAGGSWIVLSNWISWLFFESIWKLNFEFGLLFQLQVKMIFSAKLALGRKNIITKIFYKILFI